METPQTDSEPVRGLENWAPRGHYKIKMKIHFDFENFDFFNMILTNTKNMFFEKSQNPKKSKDQKNRKS